VLTIDGVSIVRASNTITDLVDGLTLNLLNTSTSSVNLSITNDVDTIVANVTKFVDAYNSLVTTVASLTKFDTTGKGNNGPLFGDGTTRLIMNNLRSIMNGTISSNSNLQYLSHAGVQFESDGQLSVDSDTMTTAIGDYFDEFSALFADTDSTESGYVTGFADQLSTQLYNDLLSYDGTLAIKTDSLDDRLDTLNDTSEVLNIRLTALQKRYQAQFGALDQLLTNLTNQNTFLTAQLNALNKQSGN
jgi:flagellar hook-associated protein 2